MVVDPGWAGGHVQCEEQPDIVIAKAAAHIRLSRLRRFFIMVSLSISDSSILDGIS